jgi:hypothetical protein
MDKVLGIARYIVSKKGKMGFFSLHKWLFLCYSFILVIEGKPFKEKFYAWANGPALPDLYKLHKGNFKQITIGWFKGRKCAKISQRYKDIIDEVLKAYDKEYDNEWGWGKSQYFHYERTYHLDSGYSIEPPWRKTRLGLSLIDRGNRPIKDADIQMYYSKQLNTEDTNGTKDNESGRHSKEGSGK